MLLEFNDTQSDYPSDRPIHHLFEARAQRNPDSIALVGEGAGVEGVCLTYSQLNKEAHRLAGLLIEKGAVPDTIIGIMVNPSLEMITGILGILKAGAAYLPIDPNYPEERIRFMVEDSGAKVIITNGLKVIKPNDANKFSNQQTNKLTNQTTNLAYVIYTSGSTGKPKGVLVEHKSLSNLCRWHNRRYSVTSQDRAFKYANVGFDASVWEIFPYLVIGARLYILNDAIKLDLERLNRYFETHRVTIGFLPTQVCEQFMTISNRSLRVLLTGGDKLKQFRAGSYQLVNNYGPTENTVVTTSFTVDGVYDNIPIGKPVDNTRIYILDKYDRLQPVGIAGELYISGDSLARGYLNRPELTVERFVNIGRALPGFRVRPAREHETVYKTGDLARWLPDGNIQFMDRVDNQVKIRGFRIESGEIENRILQHETVEEAVVLAKVNDKNEKYLCAYIRTLPGKNLDVSKLKEFLSGPLPGYMVPAAYVEVEEMPLTPAGKVNRRALETHGIEIGTRVEYVPPRNDLEEKIAAIWKEVLHLDKVGVDENFFDLGGTSLDIIKLNARFKESLGEEDNVMPLFRYTTIGSFARYLNEKKAKGAVPGKIEKRAVQIDKIKTGRRSQKGKRRSNIKL
ncbi:MAG: amino acid adenylation domain-containing protein [bacterium]|nr:amino acid adenylation domain-containing protein [bacterium]